jgi:hypothetical protein
MVRRFLLVLLIGAAFSLFAVNTRSLADANPIDYGKTVSGEISAQVMQVRYEFKGAKGDVAVIEMLPGVQKTLFGGNVKLEDASGKALADSTAVFVLGRLGELLAAQLPADGTYAITVYVDKDWDPTNAGTFDLTLLKATALEVGKSVTGDVQSTAKDKRSSYSAVYVFSSADGVTLNYARDKGGYSPSVIVYGLETGNSLFPLIYMGGQAFSAGSLKVGGDPNFRIVSVGDLNFGDQSTADTVENASFTLSIAAASK